jgi:hypothetical protein
MPRVHFLNAGAHGQARRGARRGILRQYMPIAANTRANDGLP